MPRWAGVGRATPLKSLQRRNSTRAARDGRCLIFGDQGRSRNVSQAGCLLLTAVMEDRKRQTGGQEAHFWIPPRMAATHESFVESASKDVRTKNFDQGR